MWPNSYSTSLRLSAATDSDFYCGRCGGYFTSLAASRPPVYNPDNCSCADVSAQSHIYFTMGTGSLPLPCETGLCEERRRRSSFRSEFSSQLRRYMEEQSETYEKQQLEQAHLQQHQGIDYGTDHGTDHEEGGCSPGSRCLYQDVCMMPLSSKGSDKTKYFDCYQWSCDQTLWWVNGELGMFSRELDKVDE